MISDLDRQFSDEQLRRILEEALIYTCACPAQVAEQLLKLRNLYAYQRDCVTQGTQLAPTHQRIMVSTRLAHAELEVCMRDVLTLEGWDMDSLTMPAGLRQLRENQVLE